MCHFVYITAALSWMCVVFFTYRSAEGEGVLPGVTVFEPLLEILLTMSCCFAALI